MMLMRQAAALLGRRVEWMDGWSGMDKGKRDAKEFGKVTHPLCARRTYQPSPLSIDRLKTREH